ncbi:MAG: hypothetical protein Q8S44_03985 [Flavobacteriaceae bacterium]|nr:hypothetical protein [Flavobacteriaceae bacterium]
MKLPKLIRLTAFLFVVILAFLFISCSTTQYLANVNYTPKLPVENNDMGKVTSSMSELIKNNLKYNILITDLKNNISFASKDISVLDERIEFRRKTQQFILNFPDILDRAISVKGFTVTIDKYLSISLNRDIKDAQSFADDLYYIQRQLIKKRFALNLEKFEPIADQYAALKVKPPVSEDQRKLIVQANSLNQQKQYAKAVEFYVKAIQLDPTAYPAGYYNIALLDAQLGYFENAIFEMKKYLMLMPNAPDARSAQDKIYEWELMVPK